MSEEDLELLITLDDPVVAQEEDTFNHLLARNNFEYWLGDRFAERATSVRAETRVRSNDQ